MDLMHSFTEHPASVGETYGEHMGHAAGFGTRMILAGLACMVHAVLPFLFVRTGSRAIAELNERMLANRRVSPRRVVAAGKQLL
jgi:carbon starvation protein CstA